MCGVSCGEMAVSFECYFYTSTVYFHIGDKKKASLILILHSTFTELYIVHLT